MSNDYRKSFNLLMIGLLILLPLLTYAQGNGQGKVTGSITDADGPIPYANVYFQGTTIGASTDIDGFYMIPNVPTGTQVLKVEAVGWKSISQEVTVKAGETLTLDFSMESDVLGLNAIVVTGVANPVSKIESSISISTLDIAEAQKSTPRSTAEIFRSIPGIRSESSGGDGNANITVRGVPMTDGGAKYVQMHEDGLPIFHNGDIAFATQDQFLRNDNTLARIEAIRGGSASTMASNSPAGIINFISKTGAVESGSVSSTQGLDYRSSRLDFEYGSPINDKLSFHVGGFFHEGEGIRTTGFNSTSGGQMKFNLTKNFDGGYGRIYFKHLNDRSAAIMPLPLKVEGTNASPEWSEIDGFDATHGALQSPHLTDNLGFGPNGELRRSSVTDGMNAISTHIGIEFARDLSEGWALENRARIAFNSGRFVAPFVAGLGSISDIAQSVTIDGISGSFLKYADGTDIGNGYEGNGLASRIHMFDVELNNFNNIINDFKLTKSLDQVDLTLGYYVSKQTLNMTWLWNSYLMEVNGEDAKLLDVYAADSTKLSENGLIAYGVPAWGALHRNYNTNYFTHAPYANIQAQLGEQLRIDASVRMDIARVTGSFSGTVFKEADVNNDGEISLVEKNVAAIDNANPTPVDYDYDYLSYSVGANYKLSDDQAVFGRVSHGGVSKADRILFNGNYTYTGDGGAISNAANHAVDKVTQFEAGYKQNFKNAAIFVTGFMANSSEKAGFEATTQRNLQNDYQAIGVEVEGVYQMDAFSVRGGLTYTKGEVTKSTTKEFEGNKPKRHSDIMFNLVPTLALGQHVVGLSIIGQSEAYADFNNELVMPGYFVVGAFANVQINDNLYASLNGNNLLDALGLTEVSGGSITENQVNYLAARPIPGRSITLTLGYNF